MRFQVGYPVLAQAKAARHVGLREVPALAGRPQQLAELLGSHQGLGVEERRHGSIRISAIQILSGSRIFSKYLQNG